MIRNINTILAMDAEFDESKHPRADNGQFGKGSGGSSLPQHAAVHKPTQVSSTITGVFTAAGFKKQKQPGPNNTVVYYHPESTAKVFVHPAPEGKKWSSKWTHHTQEFGPTITEGEGSALAKLLGVAVQKAETKKADEVAKATPTKEFVTGGEISTAPSQTLEKLGWPLSSSHQTYSVYTNDNVSQALKLYDTGNWVIEDEGGEIAQEGYSYASLADYIQNSEMYAKSTQAPTSQPSLTEKTIASVQASGKALKDMGYKPADINGAEVIYQKDQAKVKFNAETGAWVASTPGHVTKEGTGFDKLQALFAGKIESGVKNSNQTIQTAAEKAAMSTQQKAAAEKSAKAAAAEEKKNALYSKLTAKISHPTAAQQSAIGTYSGSGYSSWNNKLRHEPSFAKTDPKTKELDDWLHANTFDEEVTLYRKVDGEYSKVLKSIIFEGTKFIDRGYVSTSTRSDAWSGSFKFEITVPKGSKGAALGKWSQHTSEKEVLLPRNSAFIVTHYDENKGLVKVTLDQSHFNKQAEAQPQKEAA